MPSYTLYYFNGRGRGEILRMMLAASGAKYMDKRFEFNEWDKIRNNMPSMRVPVLEMEGGIKMPETMAIARYLASEHNFYPKTNIEMLRCDCITDCFYEILHDYMSYFHEKNGHFRVGSNGEMMAPNTGNKHDTYLQSRYMNTFNRIMPFMEKTLAVRDGGNKFFMGDQLMVCDMMMYCCMENPYTENQAVFSKFPKLVALYQRIAAHPKISQYLKSRPKTNF